MFPAVCYGKRFGPKGYGYGQGGGALQSDAVANGYVVCRTLSHPGQEKLHDQIGHWHLPICAICCCFLEPGSDAFINFLQVLFLSPCSLLWKTLWSERDRTWRRFYDWSYFRYKRREVVRLMVSA